MKKTILSSVLAAMLLIVFCAPAAGEAEAPYVPKRVFSPEIDWASEEFEITFGEVEYEGGFSGGFLNGLEAELELEDGTEYEVRYDGQGRVQYAEYETDEGEIYYDGSAWRDAAGNPAEGPDISFVHQYFDNFTLSRELYPDNTLCVIGLELRKLYPDLTDKWYHVLPVDLTKEGTFRYKMAASNDFYMGECILTVQDGKVTTDYELPYGSIKVGDQCLAWFTDIGDITKEFLDHPKSDFRFGEPVDIREELQGKKIALLFICNRVTFTLPLCGVNIRPAGYYYGAVKLQPFRQELTALLNQME